jgi:hypothetical protein
MMFILGFRRKKHNHFVLIVCSFLDYFGTDFGMTQKEGGGRRRKGWQVVEEAGWW